jgi:hypothetical protein
VGASQPERDHYLRSDEEFPRIHADYQGHIARVLTSGTDHGSGPDRSIRAQAWLGLCCTWAGAKFAQSSVLAATPAR